MRTCLRKINSRNEKLGEKQNAAKNRKIGRKNASLLFRS